MRSRASLHSPLLLFALVLSLASSAAAASLGLSGGPLSRRSGLLFQDASSSSSFASSESASDLEEVHLTASTLSYTDGGRDLANGTLAGWADPSLRGGSMLDLVHNGMREPINVVLSGRSDPYILSSAGLRDYVRTIGFSFECLGLHVGELQRADLGDGRGWKPEQAEFRQAGRWDPGRWVGSCAESLLGGNHFRGASCHELCGHGKGGGENVQCSGHASRMLIGSPLPLCTYSLEAVWARSADWRVVLGRVEGEGELLVIRVLSVVCRHKQQLTPPPCLPSRRTLYL